MDERTICPVCGKRKRGWRTQHEECPCYDCERSTARHESNKLDSVPQTVKRPTRDGGSPQKMIAIDGSTLVEMAEMLEDGAGYVEIVSKFPNASWRELTALIDGWDA